MHVYYYVINSNYERWKETTIVIEYCKFGILTV